MTANDDVLRHIVLDLMSTVRPVSTARLTALSDSDWLSILEMTKQHRIGPILHSRCQSTQLYRSMPVHVVERWTAAYRKSAFRYLSFRKTLARLSAALEEAGIAFAILKGAWLCQHAYSDPALRPMRDIDFLVMPDRALEAYALLENNGFARDPNYPMPRDDAIFDAKHLPAMRCNDSGLHIEVHTRLMTAPAALAVPGTLEDVALLLSRRDYHDGVAYTSGTDTLLHLIVHAAYDHQFNNGPITFCDIAVLLETAPIHWTKFWQMAAAGGWTRGCVMIFELASHYHGTEAWRDSYDGAISSPSKSEIESAALLSLQDFDHRGVIGLRAEIASSTGWFGKVGGIAGRIFPPLHRLAAFAGSPRASYWSALHYPRWLLAQVGRLVSNENDAATFHDIQRATRVRNWLFSDAS